MSRAAKRSADLGLAAITIEGGLISPDQVQAIVSAAPDAKMAADYGCPKGTNLRDEITRYFRIAQAHWQTFDRLTDATTTQTAAFVKGLLEQAFGFTLTGPHIHHREDRRFTIAWEAKGGRVPIAVAPPAPLVKGVPGDGFARALPEFGDGESGRIHRRSATVLLQDWLNANDAALWGLVFAGDRLRLMRDNASLTRPAWIEVDLAAIFRDDMFADFTALWLLIHASRFGAEGAQQSDSPLERWREAGMRAGSAARERLRVNVEEALLALGQGILDANPAIRARLDSNELPMPHLFEQMLRVIYRMIFLAVAEDRDLLHPRATPKVIRDLYTINYGFAHLRDRSVKRHAHDHHFDAWEGAKVVFRALLQGEPRLGLPALGGLFDQGLTPDLDNAQIPNRAFLAAAYKLAWLLEDSRRVRINWRDMATEELGSVYEGLLELVPMREDAGHAFSFAGGAEARGNARKTSGSYYTPDSLVQCLLDSALDPVLDRAEAEGGVDAILHLNIIDPACGSGHFLLGAARRVANRVAQLRNPDAPDYNAAMRDVVRNCIHGVDRNPMAVELAKVALWIETVEPGKPLGFLDANLQCGDSLLGVFDLAALEEGIPDDAYKPLTGDDKEVAKHFAKRNKAEKAGQGMFDFGLGSGGLPPARLAAQMDDLRHLPEDTVAQIKAKREKFLAWANDPRRYATKVACDLYVAAFLLPKTGGVPTSSGASMIPTTGHLRTRMGGGNIYGPLEGAAVNVAEAARAFHWPLAFPEVVIARGGFDVVLGNPPWEKFTILEREFFATLPEISEESNAAKRKSLIAKAFERLPELKAKWDEEQSLVSAFGSFARSSGRFPLSAVGELNLYPLFAELALRMANRCGKSGLILKSMMFTGSTWKELTDTIIKNGKLESVFDFKNWEMLFTSVGYHERYSVATFSSAESKNQLKIAVGLTNPRALSEDGSVIEIDRALPRKLNPDSGTLPQCESAEDLRILSRVASAFPTLGNSDWSARYTSGLHMTGDASELRDLEALKAEGFVLEGAWLVRDMASYAPVYEGKLIHQYDHRFATFEGIPRQNRFGIKAATINPSDEQKALQDFEILPRYWVRKEFARENSENRGLNPYWNIAFRDTTNVISNFRTAVACIVGEASFNYKAPNIIINDGSACQSAMFLSMFNSTPFDYLVRQKFYGANFTKSMLLQSFVVPYELLKNNCEDILDAVATLTNTSRSVYRFANELKREHLGTVNPDERIKIRARIDAIYFKAFGFSRSEAAYVFDTFRIWKEKSEDKWGRFREKDEALALLEQNG